MPIIWEYNTIYMERLVKQHVLLELMLILLHMFVLIVMFIVPFVQDRPQVHVQRALITREHLIIYQDQSVQQHVLAVIMQFL